jgi:hypothetical protein
MLVMRMARENPSRGYTRIKGALFNLEHDIASNTIKAILKERGIEPAPERGCHANWHTFIKSRGQDDQSLANWLNLPQFAESFLCDHDSSTDHIAATTDLHWVSTHLR